MFTVGRRWEEHPLEMHEIPVILSWEHTGTQDKVAPFPATHEVCNDFLKWTKLKRGPHRVWLVMKMPVLYWAQESNSKHFSKDPSPDSYFYGC